MKVNSLIPQSPHTFSDDETVIYTDDDMILLRIDW